MTRGTKVVHCIVAAEATLTLERVAAEVGTALYPVRYRDIAAVVSDADGAVGEGDPSPERLLAHERVNERVLREFPLVPISFGALLRSREEVVELLRSAYEALRDLLEAMRDKVELALKVRWRRERVLELLEAEDDCLRALRADITARRGSTYFARVQYARLVEALLHERAQRWADEVLAALKDASLATRSHRSDDEDVILDAAFLVAHVEQPRFAAALDQLVTRLTPLLELEASGPRPPYHFVEIRLELTQPED